MVGGEHTITIAAKGSSYRTVAVRTYILTSMGDRDVELGAFVVLTSFHLGAGFTITNGVGEGRIIREGMTSDDYYHTFPFPSPNKRHFTSNMIMKIYL